MADENTEEVVRTIKDAIYWFGDCGFDPGRPFNGQPHTYQGERGKTLVVGLRFRDVCDCFVIGWLQAAGRSQLAESGNATYNDVYECGEDIDPIAVMQNMSVEMEKRMGIYPNVDRLTYFAAQDTHGGSLHEDGESPECLPDDASRDNA